MLPAIHVLIARTLEDRECGQQVHVRVAGSQRRAATEPVSAGSAKAMTALRTSRIDAGRRSSRRCLRRQASPARLRPGGVPVEHVGEGTETDLAVGGDLAERALDFGTLDPLAAG